MEKTTNYRLRNPKGGLKKKLLKRFSDEIANVVGKIEVRNILDLGCGEGFEIRGIRERGMLKDKKFLGVDMSEDAILLARKEFPHLRFETGDLFDLKISDNEFDCVLCIEVLEHILKVNDALDEVARVCGKYAVVSIPRQPWFRLANLALLKYLRNLGEFPDHKHSWFDRGFRKILKKNFHVIETRKVFFWTIYLCRKRGR